MTEYFLEGFENGVLGNNIDVEIPEWGEHSSRNGIELDDGKPSTGRKAAFQEFSSYYANQSNTDGSATGQTATFDQYPYADCTIRWGFYTESRYCDFAWAVPDSSDGFNSDSCYRIRAGAFANEPFIRKTINDSSQSLASFNSLLDANTYYDFAVEFEERSSEIYLSLQIWEWDATNEQWVDWGFIDAVDSDTTLKGNGGIGIAIGHEPSDPAWLDNIRFHDQLGQNGKPQWTPTEFQTAASESVSVAASADVPALSESVVEAINAVNESVSISASSSTTATESTAAIESASVSGTSSTSQVSETASASETASVTANGSVTASESAAAYETAMVAINADPFVDDIASAAESVSATVSSDTSAAETGVANESTAVTVSANTSIASIVSVYESVSVSATSDTDIAERGLADESASVSASSSTEVADTSIANESVSASAQASVSEVQYVAAAVESFSIDASASVGETSTTAAANESVAIAAAASISLDETISTQIVEVQRVEGSFTEPVVKGSWAMRSTVQGLWKRTYEVRGDT
jgi:hypothetical protein